MTLDLRTTKLPTMQEALQQRENISGLYFRRKEERRMLISVQDDVASECCSWLTVGTDHKKVKCKKETEGLIRAALENQDQTILMRTRLITTRDWRDHRPSALDPIGRSPFLPSWNLHKVELFSAFISHLAYISSWTCLLFLMSLCHHSVLLRCYQFEMLNSLSRTPPLNPALLTLCHPHWSANVRISSQFSQKLLTTHYSPGVFLKFGKRP